MESKAQQVTPPDEWMASEPFRMLVESVADYAIFMLDPAGHVRTWNTGAARIKGYRAEEIIGKHFSVFYPREEIESGKCEMELAVAGRTGRFEDEGWRLRNDGTRFWANVIITAVRSPGGQLMGFSKVTRDLSERRLAEEKLRQSELRLRLLIESIQDYAIFMLDPSGRVTTWNMGAQNITQYTADEILGKHLATFYPPETAQSDYPQKELDTAQAKGRFEEEGWRVRKDGSRFWAHVVIRAMRDEHQRLVGFAKVTRDLTERKKAEREQAAREAAEQANQAKDEFLAMLGHELRNPLAPTLTALQLLKLRGDIRSSREQQIIERQLKHMVRLVDDLLDVSRITRGGFQLHKIPIDLRDAVARAIEIAGPSLEERRHDLEVDVPAGEILVEGDSVRLAQVFANLLNNAAKYTDPGGHVRVALWIEGGQAIAEVRDDGMGISSDLLPRVFDTFVQAPQSAARSAGGLGIGLALVRSFVNLHGGSVEASSSGPRRGSTFTVKLPLLAGRAGRDQAAKVAPAERLPTLRPVRVLLVDDNEDALVSAAEVLRTAGHQVRTATNGTAALAMLAEFQPEVAVLDIGLPGLDGYDLARRLRDELGPRTPRLIAVTGYGRDSDRERSRIAGFDVHLVKPVDIETLIRSVSE
jgi:PAS domain S-box-containing protein